VTKRNRGSLSVSGSPARLTDAQAIERLKEIERAHTLFSIRAGGWSVWPLFKMTALLKMTKLQFSSRRTSPSTATRAAMALRDAGSIARAKPAEVLVKTATSTLIDRERGKYKDFIFDDFIATLKSFNKIDSIVAVQDIPRRNESLVPAVSTTAGPELVAALGARLRPSAEDREAGEIVSRVLQSELGLNECTPAWATFRISHFAWGRKAYREMFRRLCTQVVIVADPGEHAAVAAARELGLLTVEFQHGLLNAYHPGYEYSQVAAKDIRAIPMADRLFLFGEYWRRTLAPMHFWEGRLDVAGSLRLDSYRQRRARGVVRDARTTLFTTQGIDTTLTIPFLRRAWDRVGSRKNFRLVIKLHPIWDADPAPYLSAFAGDDRVSVISGAAEPNTLELLTTADLHLSISSTCHYEACALGVPTVVLPFTTSENMASMIAAGHAREVDSSEELAGMIASLDSVVVNPEASSFYFEPNARENMRRLLDEALNRRKS
jgi:hypothetical protein